MFLLILKGSKWGNIHVFKSNCHFMTYNWQGRLIRKIMTLRINPYDIPGQSYQFSNFKRLIFLDRADEHTCKIHC